MNEVLHANIFFMIASVATVLFTILICLILYHVLKVVRSVRRIVERIEEGSETIREDLRELRQTLSFTSLLLFAQRFFNRGGKTRKRSTRSRNDE